MAGMLDGLANLFQNPNFLGALLGVGNALDQKAYSSNLADSVAQEQQRVLQSGGNYLDAQRAGQFMQANSPYTPSLMSILGSGMMGYNQQQRGDEANAAILQQIISQLPQPTDGQLASNTQNTPTNTTGFAPPIPNSAKLTQEVKKFFDPETGDTHEVKTIAGTESGATALGRQLPPEGMAKFEKINSPADVASEMFLGKALSGRM
jgi:hypothetical protein